MDSKDKDVLEINASAGQVEAIEIKGSRKKGDKRKFHLPKGFKIEPAKSPKDRSDLVRFLMILLSATMGVFALRFFTDNAGILPGGFNGLSKLIQRVAMDSFGIEIPFAILNMSFNAIPAIVAFISVGKKFVILSIIHVVVTSILMDIIPMTRVVDDVFLNTVFGGIIHGVGGAIALQANACSGGTDFISMTISNRYNISVWNYVLMFNALILTVSGFLFGFEPAMYSVIYQMIATMIINNLHSRYQRKTVFIVAPSAEPLATEIMKLTGHGITMFTGIGRYSGEERTLLYMVVSKDDLPALRGYLASKDEHIFMNVFNSEDLDGNFKLKPFD